MKSFKNLILISILAFSGCASYQSRVAPAREALSRNDCPKSLEILSKLAAKESDDQLVYLMDYASALQACGDYKKSSQVFIQADKLADQMDYTSITKSTGALLISEDIKQYQGDTFEKFFINASNALNYLQTGDYDSAMIEVKRMNQKFSRYKEDSKLESKNKDITLNSFAKYLSAMVWEAKKEYDDACIDYQDAYRIDPSNRGVAQDILNVCWKARRYDEFNQLVKKLNATPEEINIAKNKKWSAELLVLFLQGWGPRKYPQSGDQRFPQLVQVPTNTQHYTAQVTQGSVNQKIDSHNVYNVDKVAMETLSRDQAVLIARRLAVQAARYAVTSEMMRKSKDNGQAALAFAAYIAMMAMDKADLRQWSFLPKDIQLIRVPVEAGTAQVNVEKVDKNQVRSPLVKDLSLDFRGKQSRFLVIRDAN